MAFHYAGAAMPQSFCTFSLCSISLYLPLLGIVTIQGLEPPPAYEPVDASALE